MPVSNFSLCAHSYPYGCVCEYVPARACAHVCMQWVIYELRLDCESPVDSCWLPFTPERTHVLMRINVLWHPLGLWQPPEGLMKKYNLAKREGGISKGSLRPWERAYREGMDIQKTWGSRVSTEFEQNYIFLERVYCCVFPLMRGVSLDVRRYNDSHC